MGKLSQKHVELLQSGRHFGVVATVRSDGTPQATIVWVDSDGEHLLFNTTNARAKGRILKGRPYVSAVVWDIDDPYRSVEIEGPVELTEDGAVEHIHELSNRYQGKDFPNATDRVMVKVKPAHVRDHGIDG